MLAMFGVSYLLASVFIRICLIIKTSTLLLAGLSTEVIRALQVWNVGSHVFSKHHGMNLLQHNTL